MRSYVSYASAMEVDMVSVGTGVILISFFHVLPPSPSTLLVAGARTIFRRFDVVPVALNYLIVQSRPTVALLVDKGSRGVMLVAGATMSAATQTVTYMLRKTAETSLYVAGYLAATVAAGVLIYSSKRKRKRIKF